MRRIDDSYSYWVCENGDTLLVISWETLEAFLEAFWMSTTSLHLLDGQGIVGLRRMTKGQMDLTSDGTC